MIISHKYKCIFIRIPKCLSTSVEDFFTELDPNCMSSKDHPQQHGHETSSQVKKMVANDEWNSYFKFTFFRNPEKRFISQYVDHLNYSFPKNNPNHIRLNWLLTENSSLNNSKDKVIKKHDFMQFQTFNRWWNIPGFTYQQIDWHDKNLDFIGNMDKIKRDWDFIKEKLNIETSLKLPHSNTTNSKEWKLDYDSKLLLNIFYKEDLEFYDKLK